MNAAAWMLLAVAGGFAVADWYAVAGSNKRLEYICKPATLASLVAVAASIDATNEWQRWSFVVALAFSLAGDIFLMLPSNAFVAGLSSFFLAHVAYVFGLRVEQRTRVGLFIGFVFVALFLAVLGRRIRRCVRRDHPKLTTPVDAYMLAISGMAMFAFGTGIFFAAVGAALFVVSDTLIAWNRFVRPLRWAPVAIIVTYHVAQGLLVTSLRF